MSVLAGASVTTNVIANDFDPDGTINAATVVIAAPPAHGTATPNANGTVTYSPAAGYTGPDSFTYNVKDNSGAASNNALVSITVTAPATETITVTRKEYTLNGSKWRIDGSTTARITGEQMMIFNSATVPADIVANPPIATVPVAVGGTWTWSSPALPVITLNTSRQISVLSTLNGKIEKQTVVIK